MLHYGGNITAMELAMLAKGYIWMYLKAGESVVLVPYVDLVEGRKRFVRFEKIAGVSDWVFVDLVD